MDGDESPGYLAGTLATGPVHATVTVPGSKSQTNRALVLAALATPQGNSTVGGALRSRDTDLMIGALRTLGVSLDGPATDLSVGGAIDPVPGATVDCGLAGTVLRFVPPVAALGAEVVTFDGDEQARARPISRCSVRCASSAWRWTVTGCPSASTATDRSQAAPSRSTRRPHRNSSRGCC